MKMITLAAILALLVGCTPETPAEKTAKAERSSSFWGRYINRKTYEVCIRGNTYLYLDAGNTSQVILILGKDSKVIPCKETQQ